MTLRLALNLQSLSIYFLQLISRSVSIMKKWWSLHPKLRHISVVVVSAILGAFLFQRIQIVSPWPVAVLDFTPVRKALLAVAGDGEFWKTVLPVLSVLIGIWLTSRLSHKRDLHKDLRDRLMSATFDSLNAGRQLIESFKQLGIHGPRGGGRIRPADDVDGDWEELDVDEAAESDQRSFQAFQAMIEAMEKLEERNLELSIIAPHDLRVAFESIHNRAFVYLMGLGEMFKGAVHAETEKDLEQLFEAAKKKSRLAIRSPKL